MQEQFQLIQAAQRCIAARLSALQGEDPEAYENVRAKLDSGKWRITLVIVRSQTSWRCTAMMHELGAALGGVELFSFREPVQEERAAATEAAVPSQDTSSEPPPRPNLSIDEFFEQLERVRGLFVWRFQADIVPGLERRSSPRLSICALVKNDESLRLDPVQAVCYATMGVHQDWKNAAAELGLSPTDAAAINAAAADRAWRGPDGSRKPDQYVSQLRRRILEAIGIRTQSSADTPSVDAGPVSTARTAPTRQPVESDSHDEAEKDLLEYGRGSPNNRLGMKDLRE